MTKSVKIPKKIAGVKIPKQARKTANRAIKVGAGPVVREIAAAAIGAANARDRGERKDPIEGLGRRLVAEGLAKAEMLSELRKTIEAETAAIADEARVMPEPAPESLEMHLHG